MRDMTEITKSLLHYTYGVFHSWFSFSQDTRLKTVTSMEALSYPAVWFGVNKIAGHVGQMPLKLYKKTKKGSEEAENHPIHALLKRPNAFQTSMTFRQTLMVHALLDGNARVAIVRSDVGGSRAALELLLLHPHCTITMMVDGEKYHVTRPPAWDRLRNFFAPIDDNREDGVIIIPDADVIHVLGLSEDGIQGIPLRKVAGRSIGTGIDAEKRVSKQMQSGFTGKLFLEAPAGLFRKKEDAEEFMETVKRKHAADKDGDDIGLLREGIHANVIDMNNQEAEMAAVRVFQRQEAALLLGLEGILGDDASVSYNSAEQKSLAYLSMLSRWLVPIEQEFEYKLLTDSEFSRSKYYMRFNTGHLLKSDAKTTMEMLSLGVQSEILTKNEARQKLDMNPIAGGDELRNPAINPATKPEPATPDIGNPQETDDAASDAGSKAVVSRLSHLIGVESRRIISGAKRSKNFLQWMDNFYDKKWVIDFADRLEELGMDRDISRVHCDESKRRLIETCDYSEPHNLAENIEKCVSTWSARANSLGELSNVRI